MKKVILAVAVLFGAALVSCNGSKATNDTVDTNAQVEDTNAQVDDTNAAQTLDTAAQTNDTVKA